MLLAFSASLAGCIAYSGGDKIKQLPNDIAAVARVSSIVVRSVPGDVSAEFKPALETQLRTKTTACAKGTMDLTLEVNIAQVKTQDPALTILIGSSNNIRGQARFARADTGEVVGDYDLAHSVSGRGVVGAVGLSGAERQLAEDFADEVCKTFPRAKN